MVVGLLLQKKEKLSIKAFTQITFARFLLISIFSKLKRLAEICSVAYLVKR